MSNKGQLFLDFEPITKKQWIEKIQKDLKGKSFEKLFWELGETLSVPPFYMPNDLNDLPHLQDTLAQKALHSGNTGWLTCEYFNAGSEMLLSELSIAIQNDVTAISIEISEDSFAGIRKLFNFIKQHKSQIKKVSFTGRNNILQKLTGQKEVLDLVSGTPEINFVFGFNFLSELTRYGEQSLETSYILTLQSQFTSHTNVRFLLINANDFHNAGASVVQELAYVLNIGNSYLQHFNNSNEANRRIEFRFATGGNYFFEIAKLRAYRILWAKLLQLHDNKFSTPENTFIGSETSQLNKTIYDPYVNMLRNTTETMAAIIGGTNELSVLPFNFLFQDDDEFGKRIARNVQHLLRHETHLDKIQDIPAGSYYIENLTHLLAENVWTLFQEIESKGGYEKLAQSGWIKQSIEKNINKIISGFNMRKTVLVGINNYPNISEEILRKINDGEIMQEHKKTKGLRFFRIAEQLETIRLNTKKLFSVKPKAFLFTYGNLTMRRARAGFVLNFLGAAGFDILDNNGFSSVDEGITAFEKSDADILVVCSADEEYSQVVPDIAKLMYDKILIVAGDPKKINVSANVDYFIFSGSDILDTLQKIQKQLLKMKEIV